MINKILNLFIDKILKTIIIFKNMIHNIKLNLFIVLRNIKIKLFYFFNKL